MVAVNMKIVLYVLKVLFFFGFVVRFVLIYEGVYVVFTEFHISVLLRFVIVLTLLLDSAVLT